MCINCKFLIKMFHANLHSSCIALQAPDGAAAAVKRVLCLRLWWHSPERHADPQRLHYLLDERGACIWQGLGHQTHRKIKGQG